MFAGLSHDDWPGKSEPSRSQPRDLRRFTFCRWHAGLKMQWTEAESVELAVPAQRVSIDPTLQGGGRPTPPFSLQGYANFTLFSRRPVAT